MNPIHIVVAEDNPDDLVWLRTVLSRMGLEFELTVAQNGEQARDCLLKRGEYANCANPDLVLLDMNMPRLTGTEVLDQVPNSKSLPICILTGSEGEREIVRKHFLPKRVPYLKKPVSSEKILECLRGQEKLKPLAEQLNGRNR